MSEDFRCWTGPRPHALDERSCGLAAADSFLRGEEAEFGGFRTMAADRGLPAELYRSVMFLAANNGSVVAYIYNHPFDYTAVYVGLTGGLGPFHPASDVLLCLGAKHRGGPWWHSPPLLLPAWRAWRSKQP